MKKKNHWLVACDLSETDSFVAQEAAQEAVLNEAQLRLLHVFQVPPPPSAFSGFGSESTFASKRELREAIHFSVMQQLEGLKQSLIASYPNLEIELETQEGDYAATILRIAKDLRARRIIVGTHGRRGVEHLLLGSVAEKIVRMAEVSVLVVKHLRQQ